MRACKVKARRTTQRDERGTALIMVLLAVVVLTVFLTDVQQDSSTAFSASIAARERLKAEYHARSAINLARLLVATEPTIRRAVSPMLQLLNGGKKAPQIPVWEFADQVLGLYNGGTGATGFSELAGVDLVGTENTGLGVDGHFEVVIVDEDAKLNVNVAARPEPLSSWRLAKQLQGLMGNPQYNPLFEQLDADGQTSTRAAICGALIDWADSNEDAEPCDLSQEAPSAGAEDNYYQSIGLPYGRKNAAYDSLEELRLIRGIGDDFWATFVQQDPADPKKRTMTVWGQGKVNINNANAQTLLALICSNAVFPTPLCVDPALAMQFLSMVGLVKGFTAGVPLFSSPKDFVATMKGGGLLGPMLAQAGIEPVVFRSEGELRNVVSTSSKMFSIYAVGVVPHRGRETRVGVHAVVDFRVSRGLEPPTLPVGAGGPNGAAAPPPPADNTNTPDDILKQQLQELATNPAGQVVYWRVQ